MQNITVLKADPLSPEWHQIRRSGIGGSDAAAALGLSKFKSPLQVWEEKCTEIAPTQDNERMRWGRILEPVIRQEYAERTGRKVKMLDGVIRDNKHPFMLANLDGYTDDGRLLECKTASTDADWGEDGTDQVPQPYIIQVQHYLAVTRMPVADVAVLIGGNDFRIYTIPADRELQESLIESEAEFWEMVKNQTPPEPRSAEDVARLYRRSNGAPITASPEIIEAWQELKKLRQMIDETAEQKEIRETIIKSYMGEYDTLQNEAGETLCTWKSSKPAERIDGKRLRAEQPEIAAAYTSIGEPTRRFLVK